VFCNCNIQLKNTCLLHIFVFVQNQYELIIAGVISVGAIIVLS
jgi:hypothetical protein